MISISYVKKRKSKKLRNLIKIPLLMVKGALIFRPVVKQITHTPYFARQGGGGGEGVHKGSMYTFLTQWYKNVR